MRNWILYFRTVKSERLKWSLRMARMKDRRNAFRVLIVKHLGGTSTWKIEK